MAYRAPSGYILLTLATVILQTTASTPGSTIRGVPALGSPHSPRRVHTRPAGCDPSESVTGTSTWSVRVVARTSASTCGRTSTEFRTKCSSLARGGGRGGGHADRHGPLRRGELRCRSGLAGGAGLRTARSHHRDIPRSCGHGRSGRGVEVEMTTGRGRGHGVGPKGAGPTPDSAAAIARTKLPAYSYMHVSALPRATGVSPSNRVECLQSEHGCLRVTSIDPHLYAAQPGCGTAWVLDRGFGKSL